MEQQQRQLLVKALTKAGLDATSVENPAYPGTPDIQFIDGWIECKYLEDWPKREETTVRIEHFTPQQRVWLLRRFMASVNLRIPDPRCWLVLYVAKTKDWLMFDGQTAARQVAKDGVNKAKLFELALLTTKNIQDVIDYVTKS
jgi:hypothetical protein